MSFHPVCLEDIRGRCKFEENAKRYYLSGAENEQTLAENEQTLAENETAFQKVCMKRRIITC